MSQPPVLSLFASFVFGLARRVAPQGDRAWIEDMRLEAPFIATRRARLAWAGGALASALRFRLARLRLSAPRTFVLASAALAALVAVTLLPWRDPATGTLVGLEAPRAEGAASPAAPDFTRENTQTGASDEAREQERPTASADEALEDARADDAEAARTFVPPSGRTETVMAAPRPAALPETKAAEADAAPAAPEADTFAPTDADLGASSVGAGPQAPLYLQPGAVIPVGAERMRVRAARATRVLIYTAGADGTARDLAAGETLELSLPVGLETEDAGALKISVDGLELGALGPDGVALARKFSPRPAR